MIRIQIVICTLVMSFLLLPVGEASAHPHSDRITLEQSSHSDRHIGVGSIAGADIGAKNHDHSGGVCCSPSGMCIAILVESFSALVPYGKDRKIDMLSRNLSARTVDPPLHPPIHLS